MFDLFNIQPEKLQAGWHQIKKSGGWWVFVGTWIVFFIIALLLMPVQARLLLLFIAIPFLTISFFALAHLLTTQTTGIIPNTSTTLEDVEILEQALQTSENRFELLVNALPDRIVILDANGIYYDVLKHSYQTSSFARRVATGQHISELYDEEFTDFCLKILQEAITTQKSQLLEYKVTEHGETYYLEGRVVPFTDSLTNEPHVIWISRDITARKLSQQAVIISEKRLRAFANALPNRAIILDYDGNYHDVLKQFDEGSPAPEDVIGKNLRTVFSDKPDFADYCFKIVRQALDNDQPLIIEYSVPAADDKPYYMRGYVSPFTDPATGKRLVMWVSQDITQQKHSEQVLINSEKRLQAYASAMPNRAVILDVAGTYREVLKRAFDTKHLEPENIIGKTLYDTMPQDVAEYCIQIIRQILADDSLQVLEYTTLIDGDSVDFEGHVAPFTDPITGEKLVMWVSQDITDRKRSQQILINSEKRLRAFAQSLPDRIVVFDYEGNYRDVLNEPTPNFTPPDYRRGKNITQIFPIEFAEYCLSMVKQTIDENAPRIIEYTYPSDNGERHMESHLAPFTDPLTEDALVIWTIHDVTDHKHAQQAVIDSEYRLRSLVGVLPDRVVILDKDGRYLDILQQHYDTGSIYHKNRKGMLLHEVFEESIADFLLSKIQQTLAANKMMVFEYEAAPTTTESTPRHLEGRIVPFTDLQTGEQRVIWVSRDITERKNAEAHRLELMLEKEKLAFLRDFVDSMTHDLKTPLAVIETSLYLLERTNDEVKRHERVAGIRKQTQIITQMLDDMLAMARLDSMPDLQLEPLNIQALLEEIMVYLRPKAEMLLQQVNINIDAPDTQILASENEIRRALTNLIDNAIKYTPQHGIVSIRVYCEGSNLIVEVKDTGIGMHAEEVLQVFDRFFRTDTAKSHASGTGLGLAITKRIIELHRGTISAESEYQKGSIFRVGLPLVS